jgi:hypothetical protein
MRLIREIYKREEGYIFILSLIPLVFCSLIIIPLLDRMSTEHKAVQVYNENTQMLYAADAGVQNAIWKIINDEVPEIFPFSMTYPAITVNNESVEVRIDATWILQTIVDDKYGPHNAWVNLVTQGIPKENGEYIIDMNYNGNDGNKKIATIGVWLPAGFAYEPGSCALYPGNVVLTDPTSITEANGGISIVWENVDYPLQGVTHITQTFHFYPVPPIPEGTIPIGDVAWTQSLSQDIGLSYDRAIYTYIITSKTSGDSGGKSTTVMAVLNEDTGSTAGNVIVTYEINPPES